MKEFQRIPPEEMNRVIRNSPGHVLEVIVSVMEGLCFKIGASDEEREECVRKVRKRNMGYLFENAEYMNLEEERQKVIEERQKVIEERQKVIEERQRAEEALRKAEEESRRAEEERQRADEVEEKLRVAEELIRKLTLQLHRE